MDKAMYVAMTGAAETLRAQAVNAQNLANVSTTGFRAVLAQAESIPINGEGWPTRVNSVLGTQDFDATQGALQHTGRDLDVALTRPDAWLAAQSPTGETAYTRAGNLQLTSTGQVTTGAGHPVLADGGPLTLPPATKISIASDGTVTVQPQGSSAQTLSVVGRLQVMQIDPSQLRRGEDGLMRLASDASAEPLAGAALTTGALESSNVNATDAMVRMISLARQFELQVQAIRTAEENDKASSNLLKMG